MILARNSSSDGSAASALTTLVALKTPLSVVTSSFLAARSTANSFPLATFARAAGCDPLSRPNAARTQAGRRCSNPAHRAQPEPHPEPEVQTDRRAVRPKTVFPVYAGD